VTGADHRGPLRAHLNGWFGKSISMSGIEECAGAAGVKPR